MSSFSSKTNAVLIQKKKTDTKCSIKFVKNQEKFCLHKNVLLNNGN